MIYFIGSVLQLFSIRDNMKNVSIIVCCYNSALKLPKTLEHLAQQKVSKDLSYEVLVVDNASTDNTAELAISYWATLNTQVSLRVVREENPGLIYARICGVQNAKNELLIFCDDDNWLREDYVQNAVDIMNTNSSIGALGGQSVLAPHIKAPEWWEEHQGNYAVGKQLSQSGYANERGFVYGAGLVTRKSLAMKIFDYEYPLLLTGRKGNQCLSGEDWEYCQRMLLLGYNLYYSEDLFYWHDISTIRLTEEKLNELLRSFACAMSYVNKYDYIKRSYQLSFLLRFVILIKRYFLYLISSTKSKDRKLEMLRFQLSICNLSSSDDYEFEHIHRWIKQYKR